MAKQPKTRQWPHKTRPVKVAEMRVPTVEVIQRRYNKAQAEEYAADFDLNKLGVITVCLRDGLYWIVDGQHRIAALKMFFAPSDPGVIECSVYEGLSDAEMAELFLGLNTRRAVNPYDMFKVACTAQRATESEIQRIVESNGVTIKRQREPGSVSAVSSLRKIHDRAGSVVLGQTIRTLRDSFGDDPLAFDGQLMTGVSLIFNRFNGKTNEKELVKALQRVARGARGVLQKAEDLRARTGNQKPLCVAATIVDTYNKGLGPRAKDRLPSWWKTAE
jgi:hypothetical protein